MNLVVYIRKSPAARSGQLGEGTRVVTLSGTLEIEGFWTSALANTQDWLAVGLRNRGFTINSVRMTDVGWFNSQTRVEIETELSYRFTAEEQRAAIEAAIPTVTINYGLNNPFFNVALGVSYDAGIPSQQQPQSPTASPTPHGSPTPVQSPPSDYNVPQAPGGGASGGWNVDLSSIGLGAVSGGIVVGVIALVILLKK